SPTETVFLSTTINCGTDLKPTMILLLNRYAHSPTALGTATTKLQQNTPSPTGTRKHGFTSRQWILTLGNMASFPILKNPLDFPSLPLPISLATTTQFGHKTNPPPPSLLTTNKHTHFGLSFQINKKLGNVGLKLKDASDKHVCNRTLCKDQRYPK
ncbi:hypothetical protein VP01_6583g1, partial [Puccinia sorghi]